MKQILLTISLFFSIGILAQEQQLLAYSESLNGDYKSVEKGMKMELATSLANDANPQDSREKDFKIMLDREGKDDVHVFTPRALGPNDEWYATTYAPFYVRFKRKENGEITIEFGHDRDYDNEIVAYRTYIREKPLAKEDVVFLDDAIAE